MSRESVSSETPASRNNAPDLVQKRPDLGVIDVENIAGRIVNDARDHLRRFHGHLQGRHAEHPHDEPDEPADGQDDDSFQMFEYFVLRIIAKPLMSSRMPSSSENAGL